MVLDNSTITTPLLTENSSPWSDRRSYSNEIQLESKVSINHEEQNVTNKRLPWKDLFPQIFASVVAFMLVTQPGINMVYSNIYLSNYEMTDISKLSWLSGIMVLCTPVGAIVVGVIMDRLGRKNAFLLTYVPLLISWAIAWMACPKNMRLIYTSRIFAGIGGGMTSAVVVYVSEVAHSPYRQPLLSLYSVFFSAGVLFATVVGSLFRWQAVNAVFFAFTAVSALLLAAFLPESPTWLTARFGADRLHEAGTSPTSIRPENDQVYADRLTRCCAAVAPFDDPGRRTCRWHGCSYWWPAVLRSPMARPARVLAVVFLLQQLSGCYPVIFYAAPIFRSVIGTSADAAAAGDGPSQTDALIAMAAVRLLTSAVTCALSSRVGRRPLLIGSSLAMACSAALVAFACPPAGGYGHGHGVPRPPPPPPLVPLAGVVAFVCSGSVGVLVVPWTLVGELLPVVAGRAVAGALLVSYAHVLMFAVLKAFPYAVALNVTGDGGGGGDSMTAVFAAFAVVSLASAAYAHACLPETLGRQFHEIEAYFDDRPLPAAKNERKA